MDQVTALRMRRQKITSNISNYNPLYLYSGVGMGKTHLLNAIGFKLKTDLKVMFISAEIYVPFC